MCLAGLVLITAVNLWGIAESARALMLPMVLFLSAIFGVIAVGLVRSHPAAVVGTAQPVHISEALGVIVVLKAFAAGCSALTGIEAVANGVPTFRQPRARRAQRTELMLGALRRRRSLRLLLTGGEPVSSARCVGGGVGRAERVPQAGEVNRDPCLRGHMVQERTHRFQGGEDFAPDLRRGVHRVHRDQDSAVAVPRQDGDVTSW